MSTGKPITISQRTMRSLALDADRSAKAVNLRYVSDSEPGIIRRRHGKYFSYYQQNVKIALPQTLARIRSLVIPPAWERVWICSTGDGHLQATGYDKRQRKQYLYHPMWKALRSQTKFFHLYDVGRSLPDIRKRLKADMRLPGLPLNKVLATIVSLMESTGIRIGSTEYKKLYGTFGITTLTDDHVHISGSQLTFSFRGKKGVYQEVKLRSNKLARIVKQCRDIPGKELFQYYDESGVRHTVDSGMVNSYIRNICSADFTAKDLRTWAGTVCALRAICTGSSAVPPCTPTLTGVLDEVARQLGNTRTVCRKYYVHPLIIDHFSNNTLGAYLDKASDTRASLDLSPHEQILMKMLEDARSAVIAA